MKLIDILARELKVWPEGARWIESDGVNGCFADMGVGYKTLNIDCSEVSADSLSSLSVTREQWQAARDALLAGESMKDWDGEGLPPVGQTCERRFSGVDGSSWMGCIVLAHGVKKIFIRDNAGEEFAQSLHEVEFRPFRTAEQIEAEDLERRLVQMSHSYQDATGRAPSSEIYEAFKALDKEGYRKQEQSK